MYGKAFRFISLANTMYEYFKLDLDFKFSFFTWLQAE